MNQSAHVALNAMHHSHSNVSSKCLRTNALIDVFKQYSQQE